jgi:isoleucyl-tRNA synthetase
MLSKLQGVIAACREAYAAFDFRKVFQVLNQFVTVDVSALYVDITKDRLYCDALTSPRVVATQEVMRRVFSALARLLAPILVFTTDEAWEYFGKAKSIHIETFPEVEGSLRDGDVEKLVDDWLQLRGVIAQAVEPARQSKLIGNALDASVTLEIADPALLAAVRERPAEAEEFFILSDLRVVAGPETKASLVASETPKCPRCWRRRLTIGQDPAHPELCDRCAAVVGGKG